MFVVSFRLCIWQKAIKKKVYLFVSNKNKLPVFDRIKSFFLFFSKVSIKWGVFEKEEKLDEEESTFKLLLLDNRLAHI